MIEPLLSICIPTNGISKWVLPCLDAIYSQNVDISLFEVIITDNGVNSTLENDLSYFKYNNLRYSKSSDKGFLNLVTSLKSGNGALRKMLNHRSIITPNTINRWLEIAKKYEKSKPIIYFSDYQLKNGRCIECHNIDSFISNLSYWSSWSAGLSIWDIDVQAIDFVELNEMFPNTSLLFNLRQKSEYVICDEKFQEMQDETGKGGYDLFHTFAVVYLDILSNLRLEQRIAESTFISVKKDLYKFLSVWFYILLFHKKKYSFVNNNVKSSFAVYYSGWSFYYLYFSSCFILPAYSIFSRTKKYIKKIEGQLSL